MKFVFIADFFLDQIVGGGEINNDELISILRGQGHEVITINSNFVDSSYVDGHSDYNFIVANFIGLSEASKEKLQENNYVIYEHDHKYLLSRNPAVYTDFKAPKKDIINFEFYRKAKVVFCQSNFHKGIIEKNLGINNIINLAGNLWPLKSLDLMKEISEKEKRKKCSVMDSNIPHKNTFDAARLCKVKNWDYDLISDNDYYIFLRKLGANEKFIFLPKTPETLSRVVVEARMMGMTTITNQLIGATKEPWFGSKGKELIEIIREKRIKIPEQVVSAFE